MLKVWKDDGMEAERPEEIVVQLLRNGDVFDTVRLNSGNNWRYTWEGLEADARWQVAEYETPPGYEVSVEQQGITFVMTNTRPSGGDTPEEPEGGGTLPQTGLLWWPVPLLVCGGLLLLVLGYRKRRDEEKE